MRILVVEDTVDMNMLIVKTLKKNGYSVDGCYDGEEAQNYILGAEYDGVILDIMMPKLDGYGLLSWMRDRGIDTPVLFLTARDAVSDRVKGLDLGADDYLIKPFDFDELLARVRAMTRKRTGSRSNIFTLDNLTVDVQRRTVHRDGVEISLLPKEFTILEHLIRNQGIVFSREQLEDKIWNFEFSGSSNNIDGYMSRLRKKIDGEKQIKLIHTIRGVGWVLREGENPDKKGE
ncbi:MAG: response regulator transcription factor [Ruminococcaceae bacterium]|nr:response regulator transcription factor [Oscillospiraceae bacterium]